MKPYLYLIDGYNLLFYLNPYPKNVEKERNQMLLILENLFTSLSLRASIIFDNRYYFSHDFPSSHQKEMIEIIFSPNGLSADEYILELLEIRSKNTLVVSSDKDLIKKAKFLGAKTQTTEDFLKWVNRKRKKQLKEEKKENIESSFHFKRLLKLFEDRYKDLDN